MTNSFTKTAKKVTLAVLAVIMVVCACLACFATLSSRKAYAAEIVDGITFDTHNNAFLYDGDVLKSSTNQYYFKIHNADESVANTNRQWVWDSYLNESVFPQTTGSWEISFDHYRTDHVAQQGGWNGAIIPVFAGGVTYRFLVMGNTDFATGAKDAETGAAIGGGNGTTIYIFANNGTAGEHNVELNFSGKWIEGTGYAGHYSLAYDATAKTYYFLVNHSTRFVINLATLSDYGIFSAHDAGHFEYLFDEGTKGVQKKKPGIGARGKNVIVSNIEYSATGISDMTKYTAPTASTSIVSDNSHTTQYVNRAVANNVYTGSVGIRHDLTKFLSTDGSTAIATTGDFYTKYTGVRAGGYYPVGTWETVGFAVQSNGAIYRMFFMKEDATTTVLYVVKAGTSEQFEYRMESAYTGTGAPYTAEFLYKASESAYYINFNGAKVKLTSATNDYNAFPDLFSASQSKNFGLLAMKAGKFTDVSYTTDATAIATSYSSLSTGVQEFKANPVFFNTMFNDDMVLQRDKQVKIFGRGGKVGNIVKVTFGDKTVQGTITADGWSAYLEPMTANANGQPLTVAQYLSDGVTLQDSKSVNNVVVGEVFLANGQSNMEGSYDKFVTEGASYYQPYNNTMATDYATYNNYSNIRMYTKSWAAYTQAQKYNALDGGETGWDILDNTNFGNYSATALSFASNLSNWFGDSVPIGVYVAAVGGSSLEEWLPNDVISANSANVVEGYAANASRFYNGMIHNAVGYTFRGIIYYQGCANSAQYTKYEQLYPKYAETYRTLFKDTNLPIIMVQLPQFDENYGGEYHPFRAMQQRLANSLSNFYLVNAIDLGDNRQTPTGSGNAYNNIHPANKWEVGVRLAGVAAEKIYSLTAPTNSLTTGQTYGVSPEIIAANRVGDTVTVTINQSCTLNAPSTIYGFEYSTDSGSTWTAVNATLTSNKLTFSAPNATNIRYLYAEVFGTATYNSSYVNASSFNSFMNLGVDSTTSSWYAGMFQKGNYTNNPYFVYTQYGLPIFPAENVAVTVGQIPDGVYTDGLYYQNGSPLTGVATANGKLYNAGTLFTGIYSGDSKYYVDGVLGTGIYQNKYYANGVLGSGTYQGKLYSNGDLFTGTHTDTKYYVNGVLANGTYGGVEYVDGVAQSGGTNPQPIPDGVNQTDGLYYKNGSPYTGMIIHTDNLCYEVQNGVMTKYTGSYGGKNYVNGVEQTSSSTDGFETVNGVLKKDGVEYTGVYQNKYYKSGVLATARHEGKFYENGILKTSGCLIVNRILWDVATGKQYTGMYDGKYYKDGMLGTGVYQDKCYENGVLQQTGIAFIEGKYYNVSNGIKGDLFTGDWKEQKYVNGELLHQVIYEGKFYVDGKLGNGILLVNDYYREVENGVVGKLFTGELDGKQYVQGIEYIEGGFNEVDYQIWNCSSNFGIADMFMLGGILFAAAVVLTIVRKRKNSN